MTKLDDNGEEERPLYINTTLNTHLILVVSPLDTFSHVKQKILHQHPKCFPDFGDIEVNTLKVKRKGIYYHVVDSMFVKVAFRGVSKNWYLWVDASRKMASGQTPIDGRVVNPALMIAPPTTLVDSPKFLMNNCYSDDALGTKSCKTKNKSHPEMQKILAVSSVHDECNSWEYSLQPGSSSVKKCKKRKRKCGDVLNKDRMNTGIDTENTKDVDGVPVENSALQKKRASSDTDHKTDGDGDVESSGLHGRLETVDFDDHGKTFPAGHEESLATESRLKSIGNDTNVQNIVDDETSPASLVKKKRKVENENAQENIICKSDGEDMQNSGLVHLNELSSEPSKTSKVSRKRKKGKRHAAHDPMNLDIEEKEKERNASIVADGVSKVETAQGSDRVQPLPLHLEDAGNKLLDDVRKGSFQLEGASTNPPEHFNNVGLTKGSDDVGLTSGSQSKKTNEAKKVGVDGGDPTASSKVTDILKGAVSLSENEDRINSNEQDNTKVSGPEKTVHQPLTSTKRQIEEESDPLKSLKAKSIEELENISKKKKSRKCKSSVTEKSEICSTENHQDVGNDIPTNGSAEDNVGGSHPAASRTVSDISKLDVSLPENENKIKQNCTKLSEPEKTVQEPLTSLETQTEEKENSGKKKKSKKSKRSDDNNNKHCSTNEVEDASGADKEKPVNEIVEVGNMRKKKKAKKGKKSSAEKANLSIEENNKLKVIDICQTNVTRDMKPATISSQNVMLEADDMQKVGVKSSQPSEIEKPGEDVRVETDDINKRVCEDLTDPPKEHLDYPTKEQLGEETSDLQLDGDLLFDRHVNATQRQRGKDCHEEKIPLAEISTGAAEVRKLKKPHSTKKKAKTRNITPSVDTSAGESDKIENAVQLEGDDQIAKDVRKIGTESLHPSQVIKPKEDAEIRNDKFTESAQGKETNGKKPTGLFAEKHLVEETSVMVPNSKQAFGDFMEDTIDNDSKHQGEVSVGKSLCEDLNDMPIPDVFAEVSNSKKPQKSKGRAKKLDFPSSVDTSSNGPDLTKSQKHKGTERTTNDGPELRMSQKAQSSAKRPTMSKQGMKTHVHNPLNSKSEVASLCNKSVHDGGKSSESSSVSSGSSFRIKGRKEKAKPNINVSSRRPTPDKMGVVDTITKRKGLLATPGAIFEDKSDASSDEGETYGSGSSTRTPSDYVSSSDYSEDESRGVVVTSQHDSLKDIEKTTSSKMSDLEKLNLGSVLRRSIRFKEAKVIASQMEESESPPIEFVPDSQAN